MFESTKTLKSTIGGVGKKCKIPVFGHIKNLSLLFFIFQRPIACWLKVLRLQISKLSSNGF
jgi:hypothetical protein